MKKLQKNPFLSKERNGVRKHGMHQCTNRGFINVLSKIACIPIESHIGSDRKHNNIAK